MTQSPAKRSCATSIFHTDTYDPSLSFSSYFVSSKTLFVVRLVMAIYCTVVFIATIVQYIVNQNDKVLVYFTNLSYLGLTVYFLLSVYLGAKTSMRPTFLHYVHFVLYHTVIHFHIIVPLVYWFFLDDLTSETPAITWWRTVSMHAGDGIFMLVELWLNKQILYWSYLLITMLFLLLFMFESWVVHAVDHFWVYNFLSWDSGAAKAATWYLGLFVFFIIAYAFQMGMIYLRNYIGVRFEKSRKKLVAADNIPMDKMAPDNAV
ncbi:7597_t:CDS:2 [Paraglomus occultum]|uniref:7597_t:CDS:1 n=1 Tax=Paraglomus occultum TaxID=144539 RepID=A0A9N8Z8I3_9GLOM|nr:7597_t:CDS:2 [Paraglomus occultum]